MNTCDNCCEDTENEPLTLCDVCSDVSTEDVGNKTKYVELFPQAVMEEHRAGRDTRFLVRRRPGVEPSGDGGNPAEAWKKAWDKFAVEFRKTAWSQA